MFDVYINHFERNNAIVDVEELMFTVPSSGGFPVMKPSVKSSEDSADNFSFSMESNSQYYDAILPLKTTFRVVYDGDTIFEGRALPPSTSTVFHTKNVTCEGAYAFLNDSYYEGVQEKNSSKITVDAYYSKIINNHNTMVPQKTILRGTTGVTLPNDLENYEPTAWTQSSSLISSLVSGYGGHMKIRYQNGNRYLDWYKYYNRDLGDGLRPKVRIGRNIIDISSEINVSNIFTRVIPIGSSTSTGKHIYIDGYNYGGGTFSGKAMPVPFIRNLYSDQELTDEFHNWQDYRDAETNYGVIYKTMQFDEATTQAKLWDCVKKWIKDSYYGMAQSFTVKAVDMHIHDANVSKILLGDCVDVEFIITRNGIPVWETRKLVCKSVQYDLFNPENNSYTFGIPSDLLDRNINRKKSSKSTASGSSAKTPSNGKGGGDLSIDWQQVYYVITSKRSGDPDFDPLYYGDGENSAGDSFRENGELSGTVEVYDPDDIPTGANPFDHKDKWFEARLIGAISFQGHPVEWVAVSELKGIFVYIQDPDLGNRIVHWYSKKKGYQYTGKSETVSNFERIARMIENDHSTYGGYSKAANFRNNGYLDGPAKCYDPKLIPPEATGIPEQYIFNATLVGKIGAINGNQTYVAISSEYGIFAFQVVPPIKTPDPVLHWYSKVNGLKFDNVKSFITKEGEANNEDQEVTLTDDGTPEGNPTLVIKPMKLTEQGSTGEIFLGYDTTSATDNWKVKLNIPIMYEDADGNVVTKDGFVSASDFNIQDIPSFKTKLGVFDVVLAGKVDAVEIEADIAKLRDLTAGTIKADTYVWASSAYFTNTWVSKIYATQDVIFVKQTSGSYVPHISLIKCFNDFRITESNGVITVSMEPADGSASVDRPFNMAATQFYIDSIAAAKASVGLANPVWDNSSIPYGTGGWFPTSRTISVSTTGKDVNDRKNQWIGIDHDSWSNGNIGVYIYKDNWPGSGGVKMAGLTLSNSWSASDDMTTSSQEPTGHTYYRTFELDDDWGEFSVTVNNQTKWFKVQLNVAFDS